MFDEKNKDRVADERQQQVKFQKKLIGQLKPHPGHKAFEYNLETNCLTVADTKVSHLFGAWINPKVPGKKQEIQVKENCVYLTALNLKNAKKKLVKLGLKVNQ